MRVMMIGPYPRAPQRIDGGVAAAMTCLSAALVAIGGVDLIGVRIVPGAAYGANESEFPWPIVDLSLGRGSLSTLFMRQKRRFTDLIRRYKPDVVHAQGTDLAGLLAVDSGLPNVVTVHGLLAECAKFQTDFLTRLRAKLVASLTERRTVRRAANLIAISPYVRQYYEREIKGRVFDIPNAVSPAYFEALHTPEKGRLLFAGRIANGKGLVELLHAVSQVPSQVIKLILAGATTDSAYEALIRRIAGELGIAPKVVFTGLLDEPSLIREFERAEALVLPSFQETAPMVVQQAMAAGLAVVASNVGGIPNLIRHGESGLLFEAGNVAALVTLLKRLESNPSLSRRLGANGKIDAEARFNSSSVARATIAVYGEILSVCSTEGRFR